MSDSNQRRFFIALLPPQQIQDFANGIKQHFADRYNSCAAQKYPPHITLQPPFDWTTNDLPRLAQYLSEFALARSPVPITLQGFGAFQPRVIYMDVLKTAELLTLQQELIIGIESTLGIVHPQANSHPFVPHLTVAFRDLTPQNFKVAWPEFQSRSLFFEFIATHLTLLIHNGQYWNIYQHFSLQG
jgi:2'-5' RNA ligase